MAFQLSVSIDLENRVLTFDSQEELVEWLGQNQAFWAEISKDIVKKREVAPSIYNNVQSIVRSLSTAQEYARSIESAPQYADAVKRTFMELSRNPNFFVVGSDSHKNLLVFKETGSVDALMGALYMAAKNGPLSVNMNQELLAGAFDYMFVNHGIDKRYLAASKSAATKLKTSLDSSKKDIDSKNQKLEALINDASTLNQKLLSRKKEYAADALRGFKIARKKFLLRLQQFKQATQKSYAEDYEAILKSYNEHMGMKAPVSYWASRAEAYAKSSTTKAIYFGIAAVLGALLLWLLSGHIAPDPAAPKEVYFVRYGLFLLFVTLFFWLCRIFTRLYLSDVHLARDAKERSVMAETYLALVHENTISVEDRAHILQALFRPTKSGIVKDDAAPNFTPHGIVTK